MTATVRRMAVAFATVLIVALGVMAPLQVDDASAASGADWDPGLILSDATFFNASAMSQAEVQYFLDSKVPVCKAAAGGPTCLKSFTQSTPDVAAETYCGAYRGATSELASAIVWKIAQSCGINPQVLLVTLQKEQGLVTSTAPTDTKYRIAMGFACPDTAPCDTQYYGFFNQVYSAARQFWRYINPANKFNYQAGKYNSIAFSPTAACGSSSVFIKSKATAALYNYTPYQPNAAAVNNLYGSGDGCSSYGNRNFFAYFTDWFGSGGNLLSGASFEDSVRGWGASNGFINQANYNDPSLAADGSWFLAVNTPVAGRALTQDVSRSAAANQQYTATIQVRSGTAGSSTAGVLAVWGLGGVTTESKSINFTASPSGWSTVTVKLPIRQSHSLIRVDIYMSDVNRTLWVDGTSLTVGAAPVVRNMLNSPSFEGQFGNWVPGNGFMNRQVYEDSATAHDGSWFAATNTPVVDRSLAQDFSVPATWYDRYDFSLWVRSADPAVPFAGTLTLWGLDGTVPLNASTKFTAGSAWTRVDVSLDTGTSSSTHIRAELYLQTTGATLYVDDGTLARNVVSAGSFEGPSTFGWQRDNANMNLVAYGRSSGLQPAVNDFLAATNAPDMTSSIYQDVKILPNLGDTYQAEAWVKSATPGVTVKGTFAVWGLGGTTENAFADFTADGTWKLVRFNVPITQDDHTSMRVQIYLQTASQTLLVDGVQLY